MGSLIRDQSLMFMGVIVTMIIWGFGWPAGKVLSGYGSQESLIAIRFLCVSLSVLPIMLYFRIPFAVRGKGLLIIFMGSIFFGLYNLMFFTGLKVGFAGAGGILITIINPIIYLYSYYLLCLLRAKEGSASL